MIAYSPGDAVEIGFGANYPMPREGGKAGWIANIKGEIQAGYFFQNADAWFVNIGTESKPVTARLFDTLNGYCYLMLSGKGINAGAGVDFSFKRDYLKKTVRVSAAAYFKVWGKVSFPKREAGGQEKTQFGGGIAVGGHVDASVLGIGFYIGLDTTLTAEAPKSFKIYGSVRLCVGVKIVFKKVQKCFTVEFVWERNQEINTTPIYALPQSVSSKQPSPVSGVHILSGENFYRG